ncbi:phosphonate C-P lyase system protein PhnG [Afifella pfennigii]|uniref:phosphonate C-P lyase system protein PhnG n=1 Tax=Afifella pfennigii TaxID=209897 RepID=UPI00047C50C0|nr:phosphonate C-P lyase system protein PhnG [Afifella pfennigii]
MNGVEQVGKERRGVLSVLARADLAELADGIAAIAARPEMETLRAPEFGLVMARGRIGGAGAPFNLGEVTVTRAAVRLSSGEVGHGHVLGRERERARLVAALDALWQSPAHRREVEEKVVAPIQDRLAHADAERRAKAAATRVNFFTMVRGEDE